MGGTGVFDPFDTAIRVSREKNAQRATLNANEAEELQRLKATILGQLEIIERVFMDPASIDRVESYDNPFAAGNFDMLRRLAKRLLENS
jgi:hypothetical protein